MINKVLLKGVITYKNLIPLENGEMFIEFGLSHNSLTKRKHVNNIITYATGEVAKIIDEHLVVKDTVMVVGFLGTRMINMQERTVLFVQSLEPIKTTKNVLFKDNGVDNELFDKFINGFDINR